jgi:4-amino-4-deoxy-L-arabinose transferase-like glycosyltransferase
VYTEKPPLYFWILAGSAKLFGGWHPFAMIAPAAFSTIGCVLVTYVFATLLFHHRAAFLRSLILMTSLLFVGVGQMVRMDMFLIRGLAIYLRNLMLIYKKKQQQARTQ